MAEETIDPVDQTAPGDSVEQPELEQIVDQPEAEKSDDEMDAESHRIEADLALQLVDTLIKFNNEEFSSIEIPNRFTGREEMSCFALFAQAAPITPILASYPEGGFLFFKGVSVPKSANLTSTGLSEIEQALRSNYSVSFGDLNLADLEPVMINSYQMAAKIYNDRVDKMRVSYSANVKNAKAQVVEVSVAALCGFAVILILASLF
tara:strand:- start:658 stop:1275 length:618 start_codon:yes stop_codon:yes gene_type:complete